MTDDLTTQLRAGCHRKCVQNHNDRFYQDGYVCPPCKERLEAVDRIDELETGYRRLKEAYDELSAHAYEEADVIKELQAVINDVVSEMHSTSGEVWLSSMRHDFPDTYQFLNKHIEQRELDNPS